MKVFAFVVVVLAEEEGIRAPGVGAPSGSPPAFRRRPASCQGTYVVLPKATAQQIQH